MTDALLAAAAVPAPLMPDVPTWRKEAAEVPALARTTPPAPDLMPAPEEAWTHALSRSAAFASQSTPPLPTINAWDTVLTLVRDRLGAEDAWLFQTLPGGESLALTHGVGDLWLRYQPVAALRPGERTVFGVCLTRHETVVIHNTAEASLQPYLPDWLCRNPGAAPRAFLLVPADGDKSARGLILVGWRRPRQLSLTAAQAELIGQLLRSVAVPRPACATTA
jgi:hypothetical protein